MSESRELFESAAGTNFPARRRHESPRPSSALSFVSEYITKPVTFAGLVAAMSDLGRYWFEPVRLPDVES